MPCHENFECVQFSTAPGDVAVCGWYRPTGGADQRQCNVCNALVGRQTWKRVEVGLEWLTCAYLTARFCMQ